jgi:HK97 family phage prohead protease
VQHMTLKASALTTDLGQFTALVSTADVDREGDVVLPSAFRHTVERWQQSEKMIPLHWDHGTQPEDIIGHVDPARMAVQSNGLVVGGRVDLDTDRGQQVWRLLKSNTIGFSFGFVMNQSHTRSDGVREISSVDLYEITATYRPTNDRTRVLSTKSAGADLGLSDVLGLDPHVLGLKSLDDPAEERILIRSRDGGTEWIRVSEQPWWEELEAKKLREYERKAMPVQIARFEV